MQITISARHGHLSDATQAKIEGKVEKLLRFFDRITSIHVVVDLEHRDDPTVELRVSAEHKHDFLASDRSGEMWASVDAAVHKLEQQIKKYKQKIQKHRAGSPKHEVPVGEGETDDDDLDDSLDEDL